MWASVLDDAASLGESSRILVGFLTDLRNTGTEIEEESGDSGPSILVRKWGAPPHLVRAGKAHVGLALDLDNAAAGTATMFWELIRP